MRSRVVAVITSTWRTITRIPGFLPQPFPPLYFLKDASISSLKMEYHKNNPSVDAAILLQDICNNMKLMKVAARLTVG